MTNSSHNSESKPETLQSSSSQPLDCITISSNPDDFNLGNITIDLSNYSTSQSTYTIGSGFSNDTITISSSDVPFGHPSGMWQPPEPFVNSFPSWDEFHNMCKEYPGLEKVYEHLKAYYNMCKDDWEAKKRNEKG